MNWLTKAQTELIRQDLQQQGIQSPDLAEDLLDHLCSAVEQEMQRGLAFEEAYQQVRTTAFPNRELQAVEAQTQALLAGKAGDYPNPRQSMGLFLACCLSLLGVNYLLPLLLTTFTSPVHFPVMLRLLLHGVFLLCTIGYARNKLLEGSFSSVELVAFKPVPWQLYPVLTGLMLSIGLWFEALSRWLLMPPAVMQRNLLEIYRHEYVTVMLGSIILTLMLEVVFRGLILKGLLQKYAPSTAIFLTSLLYAFAPLNPWAFPGLFLSGLLSGWLCYQTRSLLPVLYLQVVGGLLSLILVGLKIPTAVDLSELSLWGVLGNYSFYNGLVIGSVLTTMLLLWWLKRNLASLVLSR